MENRHMTLECFIQRLQELPNQKAIVTCRFVTVEPVYLNALWDAGVQPTQKKYTVAKFIKEFSKRLGRKVSREYGWGPDEVQVLESDFGMYYQDDEDATVLRPIIGIKIVNINTVRIVVYEEENDMNDYYDDEEDAGCMNIW